MSTSCLQHRLVPRANSWWTTDAARTVTETVTAPPDVVRAFYVDLDNITLVHPLVVSVRCTSRTDGDDGHTQTYRVRDRIPLGPLTLAISYTARLRVPVHGDVSTEARQFPGVALHGVVSSPHRTTAPASPSDSGSRHPPAGRGDGT